MATFPVTATARNAGGSTSATGTITTTTQPPTGSFPMSFNDPMFAGVTAGTVGKSYGNGQGDSNKSWANANGGNQIITMNGNNAFSLCRVGLPTREGPRIGGSGTFSFDHCWIETNGSGADHADNIQAYSPGSKGTLSLSNTTIRAHASSDGSGGTGSVGVFLADNWTGTFKCRNVLFWGGQFGCRAFPDTGGDMHIDFQDVFFVGPWGFGMFSLGDSFGGHVSVIDNWTNVRQATIVNGVVVPGASIARP